MLSRSAIIEAFLNGDISYSGFPVSKHEKPDRKEFDAWAAKFIGAFSLDLEVGPTIYMENPNTGKPVDSASGRFVIDTSANIPSQYIKYESKEQYPGHGISSGRWCLAHSKHRLKISPRLGGMVLSRNTATRFGIITEQSIVAPGSDGHLTLVMRNVSQRTFHLMPDSSYAHILFFQVSGTPSHYSGRYAHRDFTSETMLPLPL